MDEAAVLMGPAMFALAANAFVAGLVIGVGGWLVLRRIKRGGRGRLRRRSVPERPAPGAVETDQPRLRRGRGRDGGHDGCRGLHDHRRGLRGPVVGKSLRAAADDGVRGGTRQASPRRPPRSGAWRRDAVRFSTARDLSGGSENDHESVGGRHRSGRADGLSRAADVEPAGAGRSARDRRAGRGGPGVQPVGIDHGR